MNNWKKLLKQKLEVKTSSQFDEKMLSLIQAEAKQKRKESLLDFWQQLFVPTISLALVVFIFISSYEKRFEFPLTDPQVFTTLTEQETLLENLESLTELEDIEKLTEEEWELLLEDGGDV